MSDVQWWFERRFFADVAARRVVRIFADCESQQPQSQQSRVEQLAGVGLLAARVRLGRPARRHEFVVVCPTRRTVGVGCRGGCRRHRHRRLAAGSRHAETRRPSTQLCRLDTVITSASYFCQKLYDNRSGLTICKRDISRKLMDRLYEPIWSNFWGWNSVAYRERVEG